MFYYPQQNQGSQKNIMVYDTTGVSATNNFVSKIQTALTPPQQTWASFEASDEIPEEFQDEINKGLQKYTDTMFNYIRRSNFDLVMQECYYDLAVGTAILVINEGDEDDKPLLFSSIPLDQVAIEESINHRLETCFRTWGDVPIADIQCMWPDAVLSVEMESQLRDDPNAKCKSLVEASIYNHNNKKAPYTYIIWHQDHILLEEELESSAFVIFRWSKINNEILGRGPIMQALPSLISLQTAAYFEYTAANLNIAKPYMGYSDGIFNPNTFQMAPNTIIPISPNSSGQYPLIPLPDTMNPQLMQLTATDLRNQINQLMFANPLGPINDAPDKTATELALRQRNFSEEINPIFTRLQQEFLERALDRISYLLERRGLLERPRLKGTEIKIKFKSPLTISQGQQDVQTFVSWMQMLAGLVGPEAAQMFVNGARYPSWAANKMGVDPTLVNSEEQMAKVFQEQKNQQQQMQMMQMEQAAQQGGGQSAGAA